MTNVIQIDDLSWHKGDRGILNHINWEVKKGEHWALLGLNGSGKTSLLQMILGYQWPNRGGKIAVFNEQFGQTNIPELRKSIGWVSSSFDERYQTRPNDTTLEVVLSGKYASIGIYEEIIDEDRKQAEQLLEQFSIKQFQHSPYRLLSQGEKRKTMIARALMAKPKLLILDEPCNGLDIYSREQLLSTIETVTQQEEGPTVIYVTHHIEEIVSAITHVLLLHNGKVVAQGEKKATLTPENLEKTFQLPVAIDWEQDRPWVKVNKK